MKITRNKLAVAIMASSLSYQAAAADFALEEIVVTAQKKSESLMDVPVSVTAVTGEKLDDIGVFDLTELDKATSGLTITSGGEVALRGTDSSLTSFTASQRVTTYFNGSYQPSQTEFWLTNYDMDRVEILRGPQGTLYGAASPSGAIVAHPKKPSLSDSDGYIRQSLGQHSLSNTQFAYGTPLIEDELAIRIAGSYDEDNNGDGQYLNSSEFLKRTESGRATLLWTPTDTFEANIVHAYTEVDNSTDAYFRGNGLELSDRTNVSNVENDSRRRINTTILGLNWDLGFADLVSQTFYSESTLDQVTDGDSTPLALLTNFVTADVRSYNQEIRLSSSGNDFWDWAAGAYYSKTDTTIGVDQAAAGGALITRTESDTEASALFTHNTFFLAEDWSLIAGLRWNKGRTLSDVNSGIVAGPLTIPLVVTNNDTETEIYWTGTVKLQHNLDSDSNIYFTFDRGVRQGSSATDLTGDLTRLLPDEFQFEQETSNSFELGYKASLMDNRLNVTAAIYHTVFKDFQVDASAFVRDSQETATNERFVAFIDNASEVIVDGIDLEASFLATENLLLSASISYTDSSFEDYEGAPVAQPSNPLLPPNDGDFVTQDLSGEDLGGLAPSLSATASANYNQDIDFLDSSWYLTGLVNYNGERTDAFAGTKTGGLATVDLSTGLRTESWDVRLWAKNVFDRDAALNPAGETAGSGISGTGFFFGAGYTNPRQVGVTASYNF